MKDELQEIENNVRTAKGLYLDHSSYLLKDIWFSSVLEAYSCEIEKSKRLMTEAGLPDLCSYCATRIPGGGCCGSHIATWYDPLILLLNLLMNVEIQEESYYKDSCRFLGKDGCTLRARYHFCVNYLCARIYRDVPETWIARLKAQAGTELFLSWKLECYLMEFFSKRGTRF